MRDASMNVSICGKNNTSGDSFKKKNKQLQGFEKPLFSVPAETAYGKVNSLIYTEAKRVMLILLEK